MKKLMTAFFIGVLLTACGGAGQQEVEAVPATFPVAAFLEKLSVSGYSADVAYSAPGQQSIYLHVSYVPTPDGFRRISQLAYGPGLSVAPQSPDWVDLSYAASSRTFRRIQGLGFTGDAEQTTAAPERTKAGTLGPLFSGSTHYSEPVNPDAFRGVDRFSYDWGVEAASAQSAWLCLALYEQLAFGTSTEADCFEIDTAGSIRGFKSISNYSYHGAGGPIEFR